MPSRQTKIVRSCGHAGLRVVSCVVWLFAHLWVLALSPAATAQELEPRAYSPSPTGTNFLVLAFGEQSGSVLVDPSIPISDVQAKLYSPAVGLGRTFGILGRQALVTSALPYTWGTIQGKVMEREGSITRSGLADLRVKFSVNLHGSPALTPQDFAKVLSRGLIVGTSLTVVAPTGQYDKMKLVNLGTNRWSVKPELGISYPWKKWFFDFYGGVWFFTENNSFFPGESTRRQDSLPALQAHVSYTVRPRLWLAGDATWYGGGATHLNDGPPTGRLNNTRVGASLSIPMGKSQSWKISYSRGAIVQRGGNFSTLGVAWQFLWFDRHRPQQP